MGSAILVDRSTKCLSPIRVMQTDSAVKRHPVGNRSRVSLAFQGRISLLIRDGISTRRGTPALRGISGHEIRLHKKLSIRIEVKMLRRQVDFHVCISIIISRMARGLLGCLLPIFDEAHESCRLLRLVDLPSVISGGDGHRLSVGCLQCLRLIRGVTGGCQVLDILRRLRLADTDARSVDREPVMDLISVQRLRFISKLICDLRPHILVHGLAGRLKCLVLGGHRRSQITSLFLEVHALRQGHDRSGDRLFHLVLQELRSLILFYDRVRACRGIIIRDLRVLRLSHIFLVHAGEASYCLIQHIVAVAEQGIRIYLIHRFSKPVFSPVHRLLGGDGLI